MLRQYQKVRAGDSNIGHDYLHLHEHADQVAPSAVNDEHRMRARLPQ
jgi:hypothetical protein